MKILPKLCIYGLTRRQRSSFSVITQSRISLSFASFEIRLALSVLGKTFEMAKMKASVYKSPLDVVVTVVVYVSGFEVVTGADGAVQGPASSAKRTFDGLACFICETSLGRFENH